MALRVNARIAVVENEITRDPVNGRNGLQAPQGPPEIGIDGAILFAQMESMFRCAFAATLDKAKPDRLCQQSAFRQTTQDCIGCQSHRGTLLSFLGFVFDNIVERVSFGDEPKCFA
ncbi:hypothetical protein [Novosphingobium sp. PASSN1]|uniref:hypothetical protein n=1 Tax=Novosphingobium sp. PASSN1 TaxID=2015561 RepID=UPI000BD1F37A|nr:hypothetical protein [Novosphingobium sp. PASSN1]OYU35171.1 MAG: hypothetical protein CFE35_12175 [Novosphingobium sp. PASSN1]